MEERKLLQIALIVGLSGLLLLFILLEVTELPVTSLINATTSPDGSKLRIIAHIDKTQNSNKTMTLQLTTYDKNTADAIYFKRKLSTISAEQGMVADITATPYNGKLIITSLKCLENCS